MWPQGHRQHLIMKDGLRGILLGKDKRVTQIGLPETGAGVYENARRRYGFDASRISKHGDGREKIYHAITARRMHCAELINAIERGDLDGYLECCVNFHS